MRPDGRYLISDRQKLLQGETPGQALCPFLVPTNQVQSFVDLALDLIPGAQQPRPRQRDG
jgi:hypothetical protein